VIPDPIEFGCELADAIQAFFDAAKIWLQPLATVIAGTLAIAAAAIAYRAATRQIKSNADNVNKQIVAAAADQQKNRDAEWDRLRRQEVRDVLLTAKTTARRLLEIAATYKNVTDPDRSPTPDDERLADLAAQEFQEIVAEDRLNIVLDELKMYGLPAVASSLSDLEVEAGAVLQDRDIGEWTLPQKQQAVFDAIDAALKKPASS
jgi:hypothetical protein